MSMINFTVEETNLIAIYKADSAAKTLGRISGALPDMDGDILAIAESASRKLAALTEAEYSALTFTPADETEG